VGTKKPLEWAMIRGLLHPHNIRDRMFYGLFTKVNFRRMRLHNLRHPFASLLLQNGESPLYVKEQMGHSSIQVTVMLRASDPGWEQTAVDRLYIPIRTISF